MPGRHRYTNEQAQAIAAAFRQSGMQAKQYAAKVGIPRSSLHALVTRADALTARGGQASSGKAPDWAQALVRENQALKRLLAEHWGFGRASC